MAKKLVSDEERFSRSIENVGDCWVWRLGRDRDGYGHFKVGSMTDGTRRMVRAHRWAYEHFVGKVPAGLQIDHLCRNRACVNPAHMEPVTQLENARRGARATATHCKRGHPFSGHNLVMKRGQRLCRACSYEAVRRHGMKTGWAAQKAWRERQKMG